MKVGRTKSSNSSRLPGVASEGQTSARELRAVGGSSPTSIERRVAARSGVSDRIRAWIWRYRRGLGEVTRWPGTR